MSNRPLLEIEEDIFFFGNGIEQRLLGILHRPIRRTDIGILYCHPFAEEKNCSHAIVVEAARELATAGYPVFRFDLSGCGDSDGEFEDSTIDRWIEDIDVATAYFKQHLQLRRIVLWGLRIGAGLAFLCAQRYARTESLILWQPVFDFAAYINHFMRQKFADKFVPASKTEGSVQGLVAQIKSGRTVTVVGYPISRNLYAGFEATGSVLGLGSNQSKVCITSLSLMSRIPLNLARASEMLRNQGHVVELNQTRVEPFWDRYWRWNAPNLAQTMLPWLDSLR